MSHNCGTFSFMANKKPDNVADNPGILPYGSNIGAASIFGGGGYGAGGNGGSPTAGKAGIVFFEW